MEKLVIAHESLGHNGSKVSCVEYGKCRDLTYGLNADAIFYSHKVNCVQEVKNEGKLPNTGI